MKSRIASLVDFFFVLLVILVGIFLIYIVTQKNAMQVLINGKPLELPDMEAIETEVNKFLAEPAFSPASTEVLGSTRIEKTNLVEDLPIPTPLPSATSLPDPIYYRNEIMLRTKNFANAMDSFFDQNELVKGDPKLMRSEEWRREMQVRLDLFTKAAFELGAVESVPVEYQAIQEAARRVGPHAQRLSEYYLAGIQNESQESMKAAGEELDSIYQAMNQLQAEMIKAGWQP